MVDELDLGRAAFRTQAWDDAYAHLSAADAERDGLGPEDLDLLARAAYLTGRDAAWEETWPRAHRGFLAHDDVERAARSASGSGSCCSTGVRRREAVAGSGGPVG